MLSFKSIAVFATLAFGAISSVVAAPANGFAAVARNDAPVGVQGILLDVTAKVQPVVAKLNAITAANATVADVAPCLDELKAHLSVAIVSVNKLVGSTPDIILAGADGSVKITVDVLAQVIAELVILIVSALGVVVKVGGAVLIDICCCVGEVLGALVTAVITLCAGILVGLGAAVVTRIGAIVSILASLHIQVLVAVLGIQL